MTSSVDTRLDELRAACSVVDQVRRAAESAEALRDRLMRQMRREGMSAIQIAQATGVHRSRVYVILSEHPEDDPALDELLDSAWSEAIYEWDRSGRADEIEDHFPLEALLARA